MPCYHPLKAYYRFRDDGKKDLVFVDDNSLPTFERDGKLYYAPISIPCGQCIGCRLEYSRQWAIRCVLEAMQHDNNYFLTLTYSDDHLPVQNNLIFDESTGDVLSSFNSHPLVPSDLRNFIKNLRRQLEYYYNHQGLRVYYCGEYGSLNARPHYHLILFNMPKLDDLIFYKKNHEGSPMWNSPFLDKIWKKGYAVIAEVNFKTCAYVARYMLKKHKGKDSDYYEKLGLVSEFSGCSRRPGIARNYYDSEKDKIYRCDEVIITGKSGLAEVVRPPRYYDRLYDIDNPDELKTIKSMRMKSAISAERFRSLNTSLSEDQYLALREGNKLLQIKSLTRPL